MEWFLFGKFLLDTLATATCCMHNFLFLHAEKGMWWFPSNSKNPVTSSCYVGKQGQPCVTSPKDIIIFGGELIDKPPRRFFFRGGNGSVVFTTGGWQLRSPILKRKKTPLYVCEEMSTEFGTGRMNHKKTLRKLLSKAEFFLAARTIWIVCLMELGLANWVAWLWLGSSSRCQVEEWKRR